MKFWPSKRRATAARLGIFSRPSEVSVEFGLELRPLIEEALSSSSGG